MKKSYIWWGLGAVVIIGLLFSGTLFSSAPVSTEEERALLAVVSDDYYKGKSDAKVTLVEYLDFECEACGAYYPLIKQLTAEFPSDLKVVTRYFPLPGHKNGLPAALAVEAAAKQGKYWEMHDMLFENQKLWGEKQTPTPQAFEGYAQQIGLDLEKFRRDVADETTLARVDRDRQSGIQLDNQGTPSFFLNGRRIDNPRSYEAFSQLIQNEINKASGSQ